MEYLLARRRGQFERLPCLAIPPHPALHSPSRDGTGSVVHPEKTSILTDYTRGEAGKLAPLMLRPLFVLPGAGDPARRVRAALRGRYVFVGMPSLHAHVEQPASPCRASAGINHMLCSRLDEKFNGVPLTGHSSLD